jgi:hypothetical protein
VYDTNNEEKLIGEATVDLHALVSNITRGLTVDLKLGAEGPFGQLVFSVEEATNSVSILEGVVSAARLPKMRTFSQTSPFFVFSREITAGKPVDVYRSCTMPKMATGSWPQFRIPLQFLCGGDPGARITLIVKDDLAKKPAVEIGRFETSVNEILNLSQSKAEVPLVLQGKGKSQSPGLKFDASIAKQPSFVDYLRNGLSLDLITGIDYTGSNGDIRNESSLHHVKDGKMNVYEQCIKVLGGLIGTYDTDQRFQVYGFGGEYRGQVSHCFPVNGNDDDPVVVGIDGILQAYHDSLKSIKLSGPTWFAPLIRRAVQSADSEWEKNRTYTILLIITDGSIQDMGPTVDIIVEASEKPLSILIVGVGNADFSSMHTLDSDDKALRSSKGIVAKRDIVQFVPYKTYSSMPEEERNIRLSAALLEEVPTQVHQFCTTHGFTASPP